MKIEKYEKKVDELIRVEDQQEAQDNLYAGLDKGTVRKIIAVLVIGIIFFLFWASTVGSEKKPHAEKARVGGFAHVFLTVVVPIFFIKRNEKLKKFCVEYFRK